MNLLIFTDNHGNPDSFAHVERKAKYADLLICLGDFTIFGHEQQAILNQFNSWGKPMLLIHGNHEDPHQVAEDIKDLENIEFIHGAVYDAESHFFLGYGGGGFSLRDKEFEEDISAQFIKYSADKPRILLLHGPPWNTKQDQILNEPVGNKSFREFIELAQPELVLCGHLHDNFGAIDYIGKSKIINPGPNGMLLKLK